MKLAHKFVAVGILFYCTKLEHLLEIVRAFEQEVG